MPLRRFTTAERVLTQRRQLERPLLLLVLLGAAGFALAEGSVIYLVLTVGGLAIHAAALRRGSELYLPRAIVNTAVVVATGVFAVDLLSGQEVLPALGHYLILIQLCKLFERKRNRDHAQLIALSLVLMVAGAMMTTGLWFALLLAAYLPLACYVAMVLTLKVPLDRQASAHLAVESRPIDPRRLAWNVATTFPRAALAARAAKAALICALAGVAVFLTAPRGQPSALGRVPGAAAAEVRLTGFSSSIRLREVGRIAQDRRVVMRLTVTDQAGHDRPSEFSRYLRARVYESYREGTWFVWRGRPPTWYGGMPPTARPPAGRAVVQEVTMVPELLPNLFAMAPPYSVVSPDGMRLTGIYPELTAEMRLTSRPVRYTASSWPAPLSREQMDWLAGIPGYRPLPWSGDATEGVPPAVAELAQTWCRDLIQWRGQIGGAGEDAQRERDKLDLKIAGRIAEGLAREPYAYTLDLSQVAPDRDPVEDFLLRTRRGHCEFFASAMTLMCRAVGVNARLGTGYLATERSPASGYLVRQSDAHAWCEVYTPGSDWCVFDPSPLRRVRSRPGALAGLRRLWDSMAFLWTTNVISYGEADRRSLFGRLLEWFDSVGDGIILFFIQSVRSVWGLFRHGRVDENLARTVMAAALAVGGVVMAVSSRKLLRRVRRGRRRLMRRGEMPAFFRRLLNLLRRRGVYQRPEQTAGEFLLDAAARFDLPREAVSDLVALLYRDRWGGVPASVAELALADRTVRQLAPKIHQ